ncbi:hypothetical protein [Pseudomonas nunensis]|uniref:hypothetical protein n=1 Tax=Pseudomonas nunensis TaxID=2961896 RepID=UPI0025AF087E|nr:hypothetical protein [Pseudomonas nunensis]MDN3222584.1 hypothetical protein [Pseudomonas nunensis]
MIKKMFATCLLINVVLFQGIAFANTGSSMMGPADSPMCANGYSWDNYTNECYKG